MTEPLSIILVGPLPPPSGGMANQTRQLKQLLQDEGIRVTVVQTNAAYRPAWIESLRGLRAVFRLIPYLCRLWRACSDTNVMHVMANSGWAWFLFAVPAVCIARIRRIPVIINYRGGLAREFLSSSARSVLPILSSANMIVVPSGFLQEIFAKYSVQSRIIPNIVNLDIFYPDADTNQKSGAHIVIARNLECIYGIDTAIRAFAVIHNKVAGARLTIAGSGPEHSNLIELCDGLGIRGCVNFIGRLEVIQMADLYRQADLVLNPSRVDNAPNSILEALACGVPVVSTRAGGIPYLVNHESTAWLVDVDDVSKMAEGLLRVLLDKSMHSMLRQNGLKLAANYSWEQVKASWISTYKALVDDREDM